MRGIHRGPVNSPHKWPVTRKMFPFDDVIIGLVPNKYQASLPTGTKWLTQCWRHFKGIFRNTHFIFRFSYNWHFVPSGPIDKKSTLVQEQGSQGTVNSPLPISNRQNYDICMDQFTEGACESLLHNIYANVHELIIIPTAATYVPFYYWLLWITVYLYYELCHAIQYQYHVFHINT